MKRKILLICGAGVLLCIVLLSAHNQTASVPSEVWNAMPAQAQKILGKLRESSSGIKFVQELLGPASGSKREGTQVVDVTPLTYKAANGKDYATTTFTSLTKGVKQEMCFLLDLKAQKIYFLSDEEYKEFLASGKFSEKAHWAPFSTVIELYAIAESQIPERGTDPEILKEFTPENLSKWKKFQNSDNMLKAFQTEFQKAGITVTEASPLCYRRIGGEIYALCRFTVVLNGSSKEIGYVSKSKDNTGSMLSKEDYGHVLAYNDLSNAKSIDPSTLVAQATPAPTPKPRAAPTPELDPSISNVIVFADMLKQAFDATQNKQSGEQFVENFVQDLAKIKKVPGNDSIQNSSSEADDELKSAQDRQNQSSKEFRDGLERIQRDSEEQQRREQEKQDRQQQYLNDLQSRQRNGR